MSGSGSECSGVVHLPIFRLLSPDLIGGLNEASAASPTSTDEEGNFFNMFLAAKVPIFVAPDFAILCMFRACNEFVISRQ
jgi:hypothetical protein